MTEGYIENWKDIFDEWIELDDCLPTTEEVALGPDNWKTFHDPFPTENG